MKKISFTLTAFIGLSVLCTSCHIVPVKGNGVPVKSEKTMPAFEGIEIEGSAEVVFHESGEFRVVVEIDSNLEQYTDISVKNNVLHIRTKQRRHIAHTVFKVDVYCPALAGVVISGSANFAGTDTIRAPRFRAIISGSGTMETLVECDDCSITISGSGDVNTKVLCETFAADISGSGTIKAEGSGKQADITVSGSGAVEGSDFSFNTAKLTVTGSGTIHLGVSEYLNAVSTGSGSIRYRGNPKIDYKSSGAGTIASE